MSEPSVNDIPDNELLQRVIRNVGRVPSSRRKAPRWTAISDLFALGSGYSKQLCRRFGTDPDEQIKWGGR